MNLNLNPYLTTDLASKEEYDEFFDNYENYLINFKNKKEEKIKDLKILFKGTSPQITIKSKQKNVYIDFFSNSDGNKYKLEVEFTFNEDNLVTKFNPIFKCAQKNHLDYFIKFSKTCDHVNNVIKNNKIQILNILKDLFSINLDISCIKNPNKAKEQTYFYLNNINVIKNIEKVFIPYGSINKLKNREDVIEFFNLYGDKKDSKNFYCYFLNRGFEDDKINFSVDFIDFNINDSDDKLKKTINTINNRVSVYNNRILNHIDMINYKFEFLDFLEVSYTDVFIFERDFIKRELINKNINRFK